MSRINQYATKTDAVGAQRSEYLFDPVKREQPIPEDELKGRISTAVKAAEEGTLSAADAVHPVMDAMDAAFTVFGWGPNESKKEALMTLLQHADEALQTLSALSGDTIGLSELEDTLAGRCADAVKDGRKILDDEYKNGGDYSRMTKERYTVWLTDTSACIVILEALPPLAETAETVERIYADLYKAQADMIHSKSFKYYMTMGAPNFKPDTGLSDAAKEVRRAQIRQYAADQKEKLDRIAERKKALRSRYWVDHPEEHQALLDRIEDNTQEQEALEAEYERLEDNIRHLPEKQELSELYARFNELKKDKAGLSFFDRGRKKRITAELEELRTLLPDKEGAAAEAARPLRNRMQSIRERISALEETAEKLNARLSGTDD